VSQSSIQVTAGSGTHVRTSAKVISATTRHEQYHQLGEPDEATYTVSRVVAASMATADSHLIQIMAGGTLPVYVRRIRLYQSALATTAAMVGVSILRLTTAGTGGTALTPAPRDTTDAASGATAMMLPSSKGTESTLIWSGSVGVVQTVPTSGVNPLILDETFGGPDSAMKSIRIPAGTANGICLKNNASAGTSVIVHVELTEAGY
jgi:hypothetical protein